MRSRPPGAAVTDAPWSRVPIPLIAMVLLLSPGCTPESSGGDDGDARPPVVDEGMEAGQLGDVGGGDAGDAAPDGAPADAGPDEEDAEPEAVDMAVVVVDAAPPEPDMIPLPQCRDARDNDGDGRFDLFDPGCVGPDDDDERDPDPLPACGDGRDNDEDGATDYPADDDCEAAGGTFEGTPCAEGLSIVELGSEGGRVEIIPEDGGALAIASCGAGIGRESVIALTLDEPSRVDITATPRQPADLVVYVRGSCRSRVSELACGEGTISPMRLDVQPAGTYYIFVQWAEQGVVPTPIDVDIAVRSAVTECNDGRDNDGDGFVDLLDPGCRRASDELERQPDGVMPQCVNGVDDDGDGRTDYPDDPQCEGAGDPSEAPLCPNFEITAELGADFHVLRGSIPSEQFSRVSGSCGGFDGEHVYALVVDEPSLLQYEADHGPQTPDVVYVRAECGRSNTELACQRSPVGAQRLERLEPGVYFLFVEGDFADIDYEIWLELSVLPPAECQDGEDNDGDGLVDLLDPGCAEELDDGEAPDLDGQCSDGLDNDGDGDIDFPDDDDCRAAGDPVEALRCADLPTIEVDQAGGVFEVQAEGQSTMSGTCGGNTFPEVVFALTLEQRSAVRVTSNDFGDVLHIRRLCDDQATQEACSREVVDAAPLDAGTWYVIAELDDFGVAASTITIDVVGLERQCNDGVDNDGDGLIDDLDPGCARGHDDDEADPEVPAVCANGIDDDGDGRIDHPADRTCAFAGGDTEEDHCVDDWPVYALGQQGGRIDLAYDLRANIRRTDCGFFSAARGSMIALTLEATSDVTLASVGDEAFTFELFDRCAVGADELRCVRGDTTFQGLPPGVWYILAQPSAATEATIQVDVRPSDRDCNDGLDNDGDGLTDLDDPGCERPLDDSEIDPVVLAPCANGEDDDGDGFVDFPDDPGCRARGDSSEALHCAGPWATVEVGQDGGRFVLPAVDGISLAEGTCDFGATARETVLVLTLDERSRVRLSAQAQGQGVTFFTRTACDDPDSQIACEDFGNALDMRDLVAGTYYVFVDPPAPVQVIVDVEVISLVPDCSDDLDNDGDGLADTADPGCVDSRDPDETDPPEVPACADGVDNDGDGRIDWPADPDCRGAGAPVEAQRCLAPVSVFEVGPEGGVVDIAAQLGEASILTDCQPFGGTLEAVLAVDVQELSRVRIDILENLGNVGISARTACDLANTQIACDEFRENLLVPEAEAGTLFILLEPDREEPMRVQVTVESLVRDCSDEIDNDADGLVDAADLGCRDRFDDEEADDPDPAPACGDGLDNDEDGLVDWPDDPDCAAAGGPVELTRCEADVPVIEVGQEGGVFDLPAVPGAGVAEASCRNFVSTKETVLAITLDEPSRVSIESEARVALYARDACDEPESEIGCNGFDDALTLAEVPAGTFFVFVDPSVEAANTVRVGIESLIRECNDEVDNDDDDLIDLDDPGCLDGRDDDETDPEAPPVCADGIDNDDDGDIDYPDDIGCRAAGDISEEVRCLEAPVVATLFDEGAIIQTDTTGLENTIGFSCAGGGQGGENVIVVHLGAPAAVDVEIIAADYDTALEMRTDCDDAESLVECDDDGAPNFRSRITRPNVEAGTYYFIVDGYSRNSGTATVDVRIDPL